MKGSESESLEEIVFVVTPRCGECKPQPDFKKRLPCIGCEKLTPRAQPVRRGEAPRHKPVKAAREALYCQMLLLRAQGLSYAQIAQRLKAPRSTVQAVVSRGMNAKTAG